jgi:hypothetical protein
MRGRLRMAIMAACIAAFTGISVAQASQTVSLDTHVQGSGESAGPVSSAANLTAGERYDLVVTGTASIWPASQWSHPGTACGASEEMPMFPSPGAVNGPTGWDAETVFAVPPAVDFLGFSCVPSQIPFLSTSHSPGGFQISVKGAGGFTHVTPIGGDRSTPTANHTYTYSVTGTGKPASFRFVDDPVSDDYGIFMIKVLTSAECAAVDCEASAAPGADQTVAPTETGGVKGTSVVRLPGACHSRRDFPVHFRMPRGVEVGGVTEFINGALVHSFDQRVARHLVTAGVDLRGFPVGTFTLELRVTTTRGQVLRTIRTYHTCKPKKAVHHKRR